MIAVRQDSLVPPTQYAAARGLIIRDVHVKTVLSKSGIPGVDYCVNPYVGCSHACRYCYATFMKRFAGHLDEWGSFVDVKINAPHVLDKQLAGATALTTGWKESSWIKSYGSSRENYGGCRFMCAEADRRNRDRKGTVQSICSRGGVTPPPFSASTPRFSSSPGQSRVP